MPPEFRARLKSVFGSRPAAPTDTDRDNEDQPYRYSQFSRSVGDLLEAGRDTHRARDVPADESLLRGARSGYNATTRHRSGQTLVKDNSAINPALNRPLPDIPRPTPAYTKTKTKTSLEWDVEKIHHHEAPIAERNTPRRTSSGG